MRETQPGDYFLLPFAEKGKSLLIKAVRPVCWDITSIGFWECAGLEGFVSTYLLRNCKRCPPPG